MRTCGDVVEVFHFYWERGSGHLDVRLHSAWRLNCSRLVGSPADCMVTIPCTLCAATYAGVIMLLSYSNGSAEDGVVAVLPRCERCLTTSIRITCFSTQAPISAHHREAMSRPVRDTSTLGVQR